MDDLGPCILAARPEFVSVYSEISVLMKIGIHCGNDLWTLGSWWPLLFFREIQLSEKQAPPTSQESVESELLIS